MVYINLDVLDYWEIKSLEAYWEQMVKEAQEASAGNAPKN